MIHDFEQLRAIAPAWRELLDNSSAATAMCSPEWLLTWWHVYGGGRELQVGLFYEGEQLVGLAPLCRRTYWHRPGIPFRRLEFLGSDVDENDGVCSDYLNLIARVGHETDVCQAFVQGLGRGDFGRWDECVLAAMDGSAQMTDDLTAALQAQGLVPDRTQTAEAPFLTLPPTWDELLRGLSKKKRQSLTYALRDFHVWAGADWRLDIARTPNELAHGLASLIDLHCRRWQDEGHGGAFAAPRFQAFHEKFTRQALEQQQLLLMTIQVRGEPVAGFYGLVADRKLYFYQCGRMLGAPAKVRLGIIAVIFAMQEAMKRGLGEFDFLAGAAQYKQLFTSTARPIVQLRLARPGARELLRRAARGTVRWIQALRGPKRPVAGEQQPPADQATAVNLG